MIIPGEADQMRRDIDEIRERREAEHQVVDDGTINFQHFKEIIIGSFLKDNKDVYNEDGDNNYSLLRTTTAARGSSWCH